MCENGLELAVEKTELIKYLGLQVDARLKFIEHSEVVTRRAFQAGKQLSYLLPNTRGPRKSNRRILASVVISRLLYGAPIWYAIIAKKGIENMAGVLRRTMITSNAAAAVVSGIPLLHLLAEERVAM